MKTTQPYRHCTPHNGRWTFQLNILGFPLRTREHFSDAESAALVCDLVKHYLRTEFKLDLPCSLNGEQFSSLAYSRRSVNLSDCRSVLSHLPEDVREFIEKHRSNLCIYRESAPPETTASKFRRSDMIKVPAVREWVEQLERAEMDATAFAEVPVDSFFLRLKVVASSLTAALKSLRLAIKMHDGATNPRLVQRGKNLAELIHNFELNLDYVEDLTGTLRAEQVSVETAVATLEANRPNLS